MSKLLKIATIALTLLQTVASFAEGPRLRYGINWGYNAMAGSGCEYTYLTDIGYRVSDGENFHPEYYTNAFVSADFGVEFLRSLALTARVGYRGISEGYRAFPAELQLAWFIKGYETSGIFVCAGGGTALTEEFSADDNINLVFGGAGYRRSLSRKISLDGFIKIHHISCSPLPVDEYDGVIPRERTVYSRSTHVSVDFGIALYF